MPAKTLLGIDGGAATPPRLSSAAIVVSDSQQEYVNGRLALPDVAPALDEISHLLARARARMVPIIHIVHHGNPGGLFDPESPAAEIASPATPAPGEPVVGKRLPNAFASTDLAARLAARSEEHT